MLNVLSKIICGYLISVVGFYINKKLLKSETSLFTVKNIFLITILTAETVLFHKITYNFSYTILIYMVSIIIYKEIFDEKYTKVLISTGIYFVAIFLAEIVNSLILINFFSVKSIRSIWYLQLLANVITNALAIIIMSINPVNKKCALMVNSDRIRPKEKSIFMLLLILSISCVFYNIGSIFKFNIELIIDMIIILTFIVFLMILINNNNKYKKLNDDYDILLQYTKNYEEWIEREQLMRHEYKNQLAMLEMSVKDKRTQTKIQEIIKENINIKSNQINNLRNFPSTGGLKGLLYYKIIIAQNNNITIDIDVSKIKENSLNELSKDQLKTIGKIIGIYFDNAIEAAEKSKKKYILLEIYQLEENLKFVFTNTFSKTSIINDNTKKGVSSKGKNRGLGLYFVSKLIDENKWLKEKKEIIKNLYIQEIEILGK